MDTMTYAAVAVLPWSVAQQNKHPVVPEAEFTLRQSRNGNPAEGESFTGSQLFESDRR
jgi:hypothetical protein